VQTHRQVTRADAVDRAIEMLKLVEIPAPERRIKDYPHQLSGGMRQRVMIAEALLLDPEVLLADEPTTALDVTIQAQILDIMYRLNQDTGTAIVLITHNLGLVAESANRVVVMYAGKVVEEGPAVAIFDCAGHPYTQGLLRSLPKPRRSLLGKHAPLYEMSGIVPSLFNLPTGCAFHPRCPSSKEICRQQEPPRFETEPGHFARCWLFERAD